MHSIRIGSVFGIELRVDYSIVAIFGLLTWEFAALALPAIVVGYPTAEYWAVAAATTSAVLVTLAAHEVSHSIAARRRGIAVRDITMWMLGGIATVDGTAKTPRDDFAIAIAGPAASAAIGGAGTIIGVALAGSPVPRIIVAGILLVAMLNLILAAFNLVPAAPLDGGRALRAWLWHRSSDRTMATITAARAGVGFAWLLILAGIAELVAGSDLSALWLILLGWFVHRAARREQRDELVRHGPTSPSLALDDSHHSRVKPPSQIPLGGGTNPHE